MCSPRPSPTPPQGINIADRNAEVTRLQKDIQITSSQGPMGKMMAATDEKALANLLKMPVDPASAVFARTGTTGQTVSPGATSVEIAPSVLQGTLAKRATSTLRIPVTPPTNTP